MLRLCALAAFAALLTAVLPTSPAAAQAADPPAFDRVITFGDSYAAGSGIWSFPWNYDDSDCLREDDTTPGAVYADRWGGGSWNFACEGDGADEISDQITDRADFLAAGTNDLILVSGGGNDVRSTHDRTWGEIIINCLIPDAAFSRGCHKRWKNQINNLDEVEADLAAMYRTLVDEAPDATIRVFGYPEIADPDPGCTGITINRHEAAWIDEQVRELNARIIAATSTVRGETLANIRYIDTTREFAGHGFCRRGSRWIDGIQIPAASTSFHPNQEGYDAYYRVLARDLTPRRTSPPDTPPTPRCENDPLAGRTRSPAPGPADGPDDGNYC